MRTSLDSVVRAGAVAVAAISQRSLDCDRHCAGCGAVWACGQKRPVAILVRRETKTLAFGVDGAPIALEDLDQRFPGKRAEFERAALASADALR